MKVCCDVTPPPPHIQDQLGGEKRWMMGARCTFTHPTTSCLVTGCLFLSLTTPPFHLSRPRPPPPPPLLHHLHPTAPPSSGGSGSPSAALSIPPPSRSFFVFFLLGAGASQRCGVSACLPCLPPRLVPPLPPPSKGGGGGGVGGGGGGVRSAYPPLSSLPPAFSVQLTLIAWSYCLN